MSDEDLLGTEKPPAKKKVSKKAAAKPVKAKKAKAEKSGRPVSAAVAERQKEAIKAAKLKNGVANIDLAKRLGVSTAASQSVCRPLVAAGVLKMQKDKETGRVVYRAA